MFTFTSLQQSSTNIPQMKRFLFTSLLIVSAFVSFGQDTTATTTEKLSFSVISESYQIPYNTVNVDGNGTVTVTNTERFTENVVGIYDYRTRRTTYLKLYPNETKTVPVRSNRVRVWSVGDLRGPSDQNSVTFNRFSRS